MIERCRAGRTTASRPRLIVGRAFYAYIGKWPEQTGRAVAFGVGAPAQCELVSGRRIALWRLGDEPALCVRAGVLVCGADEFLADPADERIDPGGGVGVHAD